MTSCSESDLKVQIIQKSSFQEVFRNILFWSVEKDLCSSAHWDPGVRVVEGRRTMSLSTVWAAQRNKTRERGPGDKTASGRCLHLVTVPVAQDTATVTRMNAKRKCPSQYEFQNQNSNLNSCVFMYVYLRSYKHMQILACVHACLHVSVCTMCVQVTEQARGH